MLLSIICTFHEALCRGRNGCQEDAKAQLKYQLLPTHLSPSEKINGEVFVSL